MSKRILTVFLCYILVVSTIIPISAVSVVGLENFSKFQEYQADTFSDVEAGLWYSDNIASVYEYGMMSGKGDSIFDPVGNVTLAEVISIADRIYGVYNFGAPPLFEEEAETWYAHYVEYALNFYIINGEYPDYNAPATRAQFAQILAASIDPIDLVAVNLVDDGAIPDVDMSAEYADAVYLLYRAGILAGSDELGTFNPDSTITRAEAAAIITRMIDPSLRVSVEFTGEY